MQSSTQPKRKWVKRSDPFKDEPALGDCRNPLETLTLCWEPARSESIFVAESIGKDQREREGERERERERERETEPRTKEGTTRPVTETST